MRAIAFVVIAAACGKSTGDPVPAKDPPPAPAPALAPATKKLAVDALGIEVDAPSCAEATQIDPGSVGVGPDTPACPIAFPGVVFTRTLDNIAESLDDQVKAVMLDDPKPTITRKDKTATGWIVAWKTPATADSPARPGINVRYEFAGTKLACIAWGPYTDEQARVLAAICTSARPKR